MPDATIYIGKITYDGLGQGFAESYFLKGTDLATAKTAFQVLLAARLAMLHEDISIVYSVITQLGKKRKSFIVPPTATDGTLTDATMAPNRIQDAILVRQETGEGDVANRYIHGVPDKCVINGVYTPDTGSGAWDPLLTTFLTALKANTQYKKSTNVAGVVTLSLVDWNNCTKRGYSYHKCGRPFGQQRGRVLAG